MAKVGKIFKFFWNGLKMILVKFWNSWVTQQLKSNHICLVCPSYTWTDGDYNKCISRAGPRAQKLVEPSCHWNQIATFPCLEKRSHHVTPAPRKWKFQSGCLLSWYHKHSLRHFRWDCPWRPESLCLLKHCMPSSGGCDKLQPGIASFSQFVLNSTNLAGLPPPPQG